MARERSRYQKGRVVSTEAGGWEIHYNVYVTDPSTGKPKRRHRSRQGLIFKVMNTAWPVSGKEDQTQEPLWWNQLPPGCYP